MSAVAVVVGAGPHLAYVAGAYGFSALVLVALTVDTLLRARRWRRRAELARGPGAPP